MPRPDLSGLRKNLLEAGISPRHVHRAISEIDEHFEDLIDANLEQGFSREHAERQAVLALGDLSAVAAAMSQQPDLKSWAWHYPRLALLVYPLACVAALPAVPVRAGVENVGLIARWATCLLLSGFLTACLFLVLQLSIQPQI